VVLPVLFLPPDFFAQVVRGLYGVSVVISSKEYPVIERLDGVYGLYFLRAMNK
jgi:hypothetical protein